MSSHLRPPSEPPIQTIADLCCEAARLAETITDKVQRVLISLRGQQPGAQTSRPPYEMCLATVTQDTRDRLLQCDILMDCLIDVLGSEVFDRIRDAGSYPDYPNQETPQEAQRKEWNRVVNDQKHREACQRFVNEQKKQFYPHQALSPLTEDFARRKGEER